jgi:ribose transport system ATP-binding protein
VGRRVANATRDACSEPLYKFARCDLSEQNEIEQQERVELRLVESSESTVRMGASPPIALKVVGATKRFGNSLALDNASLIVEQGSVCALLGANGSGKSTLIKALAGYHVLDAGVVEAHGEELNAHRLADQGKLAGLRFVHQDLALIPDLSIADNLALGRGYFVDSIGSINWKKQEDWVRRDLSAVGLSVHPRERVANLGPVDRTLVAIARALDQLDSRRNILILDEPTARLPQSEASKLISRLEALKLRGLPIVYVTHRLDEVYRLADSVTVLRDGRVVFGGAVSKLAGDDLRRLITGTEQDDKPRVRSTRKSTSVSDLTPVLEIKNLSSQRLKAVSLNLHRGEVLGVTGLIGSGRSELGRIIYGLQPYMSGELTIAGKRMNKRHAGARPSQAIGYIPQDRRSGLFLNLSVGENVVITAVDRLVRWYGLSPRRVFEAARAAIRQLQVRPADPHALIANLSGGNQQKVALGKWLQLPLEILILDEPTQAIDVGTKQDLMTTIRDRARAEGLAVLWLESDVEELVRYADRILVMNNGQITAEFAEPPFELGEILAQTYWTSAPRPDQGDSTHAAVVDDGG